MPDDEVMQLPRVPLHKVLHVNFVLLGPGEGHVQVVQHAIRHKALQEGARACVCVCVCGSGSGDIGWGGVGGARARGQGAGGQVA